MLFIMSFRQEEFLKNLEKIYFSLCDLEMQRIRTVWTITKEGYIRIIPTKFGKKPKAQLS